MLYTLTLLAIAVAYFGWHGVPWWAAGAIIALTVVDQLLNALAKALAAGDE